MHSTMKHLKQKIVYRQAKSSGADDFTIDTPDLLKRIYLNRGMSGQALDLSMNGLPRPESLKGITRAVELLITLMDAPHRITVVGDFDADGATSTALVVHLLRTMGFCVDYFVPNRFEYGYGLSPEIVKEVSRVQSPDLIITVDNGISSVTGVALAKELGIQVIVTDHHLPGKELPDADAIVNPNQPGCEFPSKNLAGVGVAFYLMSALRSRLREQDYFKQAAVPEPNMADYLDLVALGTVADVVTLDHFNRILVQQGLLRIRAGRTRPGIQALIDISKKNPRSLHAGDFGFALAPRLNAAGRMDDMSIGIECLLSDSLHKARHYAVQLDNLNMDRKSVEKTMKQEAQDLIAKMHFDEGSLPWGLCVFDETWHQGVVGILASRIKERYHRPVIAFALEDAIKGDTINDSSTDPVEMIKGSARSIEGVHIRDVLDAVAAEHPGLLEKFGGHAMAAGLSLEKSRLPDFQEAFDQRIKQIISEDMLQSSLYCDGELQEEDLCLQTARQLREAGPWGQGFPEPLFSGFFTVVKLKILNQQHAKMVVQRDQGNHLVDAIAFFVEPSLLEQLQEGISLQLVYRLDVNEFRGQESVQLMVDYFELTDQESSV